MGLVLKMSIMAAIGLGLFGVSQSPPATPALRLDHVWIVVSPNAPERAALERAGFHISPQLNRHDGQGTASITAEFYNAFLELIWPDPTVKVDPGFERGVEKFRQRMNWRTSGWCPFGIGMARTGDPHAPLPVPAWSIAPGWLPPGSAIEIMTPRDDAVSPSFFVSPKELNVSEADNTRIAQSNSKEAALYAHPLGVKRLTSIRLIAPKTYQPIAALSYLQKDGIVNLDRGDQWTIELVFDGGTQKKRKDLRPDLPLLLRY